MANLTITVNKLGLNMENNCKIPPGKLIIAKRDVGCFHSAESNPLVPLAVIDLPVCSLIPGPTGKVSEADGM